MPPNSSLQPKPRPSAETRSGLTVLSATMGEEGGSQEVGGGRPC